MNRTKKLQLYSDAQQAGLMRLDVARLANEWADDTQRLGAKLQRMRWLASTTTSAWGREHWAQVARQLERKINHEQGQF